MMQLIILIVLVFTSAFFSASEIGLMSINRYRLRHLARKQHRSARLVNELLKRTDRVLGVILIGNTFANIMASAVTTVLAVRYFGEMGVAIATVLLTIVILIFGEMAPKTVAALNPERVAFILVWPLKIVLVILWPVVWMANLVTNGFLRLLGVDLSKPKSEHLSGEELRSVVLEATGVLPTSHRNMLLSIFDLEKVTVDDVMIVRSEISGVDLTDTWDEILQNIKNAQHTRMPLYDGDINHVLGMLNVRDLMSLLADDRLTRDKLVEVSTPCYYIPEGTLLSVQLLNFKKKKIRSGLVVDEYGDIVGLITIEDILVEIVGEFSYDVDMIIKEIHLQADGSYLIDGGAIVREINQALKWKLPSKGPKTLSGLIIEYLEHIPNPGTCMRIAGYPIEVVQMKDNMVKTARVIPASRDPR